MCVTCNLDEQLELPQVIDAIDYSINKFPSTEKPFLFSQTVGDLGNYIATSSRALCTLYLMLEMINDNE